LHIAYDRNIGIAHTSPKSKLSIVGDGSLNTYSGVIGIENTAQDKWGSITLTDDIDTASSSSNYYLIGRGSTYADRCMSFHVPTAANYGSGSQPKFVFASSGSDELFTVEASTGDAYHKGSVGIGTAGLSSGIQLQIGNTANNSAITRVTNGTTFVDLTASSSGKAYLEVGSNHPLILATNATERMQITADGVVSAPIASTHGGQLNGGATPDPLASYLGSNGADFGTTAIYRTPVITSSSTTQATSQFLSIYSSGHWGQYPVFRFKVYSTYYTAGYREYVGRVSHSQAELVEVQLNGTTSFIGSGGQNSITMSSAVSSGLAAHSGQARFRRDFTLTSFGVYGRCYVVVEIMYGGNAYYGSNTTTADLDADGNSGGSYHFKTMSLAQGQGTFSST
jgi:hypothetical protein